ncbi:ACP S-malonyltransferase [Micromonospora rifamycinica]|uniref:ACP S-malonyltransferase n=1 Tax=Micromonospora TaxID=1873 RepID=UPI002E2133C6
MFVIMAPGQGAQTPGMLAGWLRRPERAELVQSWSEAAGCDLIQLGTRAPAAEIARTEHTQPLLVAAGLLALAELADLLADDGVAAVAGHSVGELTAAAYAGVLTPTDAIRLAGIRGRAMAAACADAPTSMLAVVGGEEPVVLDRIAELGLSPATFNGPGQIVAAGLIADLDRLAASPPPGAAVKPLAVAGAFHTRHMEPARATFAAAVAEVPFADPRQLLLSNADGLPIRTGEQARERLVGQLVRPVRWDRCLTALDALAPTLSVALPPARTLAGVLKRQLPHLDVLPVHHERDLDAVRRRVRGGLIGAGA